MSKKIHLHGFLLLILASLLALGLSACPLPTSPTTTTTTTSTGTTTTTTVTTSTTTTTLFPRRVPDDSGAVIVRHGSYLYKIGGKDDTGAITSTVLMARITLDADGNPAPLMWTETATLPEGRAFAAVFAAGNFMYVLGGDDDYGPTSTIFFTSVKAADGTLGFGAARTWQSATIPLDGERSHAAWEVHDGRVFLIGGKDLSGATDSIIHARITQDGPLGQWYQSPQKLPSARYDSASTIRAGILMVAGGASQSGNVLAELVSFPIGAYGLLESRSTTVLPKALSRPLLLSDGDSALLGGGYDSDALESLEMYRFQGGAWFPEAGSITAEGPSSGRSSGALWYVEQPSSSSSAAGVGQKAESTIATDRLVIVPGSGMVVSDSYIRMKAEPGVTIRYRRDAGIVSASDSVWVWNTTTPGKITATGAISFKGFSSDGSTSEQVQMDYRIRATGGIIVSVYGDLVVKSPGEGLDTINIRDNIYDPLAAKKINAWCRLKIYEKTPLSLSFADANSPDGGMGYTANIKLSVFESDYYTTVLDESGMPVLECTTIDTDQPLLMTLNPGDYYILIQDINAPAPGGRILGLAFSRR